MTTETMTPKERYLAEKAAEPAMAQQVQELTAKLDRLLAMEFADHLLTALDQYEDVEEIIIEYGETQYDNGPFPVPNRLTFVIDGNEVDDITDERCEKLSDTLRDLDLRSFKDQLTHSETVSLSREDALEAGFDREQVAKDLGLIETSRAERRAKAGA